MELFCITDTTYTLVVDISASNIPGDSLEIKIDDQLLGIFDTLAFPITLNDIVYSGNANEEITICAKEDNSCCGILEYESPTSYCAEATNYDILFEFYCDSDSTYEFIITPVITYPEYMSSTGNLFVSIDANSYEIGNSYTFSGVELLPNSVWHEIQAVYVEPLQGLAILLIASPNCEELCTLESIELVDSVCTTDSTYNLVVDPIWMTPDELVFLPVEISVNGESLGTYSQDSSLYNVFDIPTSADGVSNLKICIPDIPFDACCFTMEYNEPNCSTTGVTSSYEAQEIRIYPNPTHDYIRLNNIEGELRIFDSSGKLVVDKNEFDQQIDLRLLPPGVYFLKIVGEDIWYTKFIKQ